MREKKVTVYLAKFRRIRAQWLLNKWINKREIAVEFAYMKKVMFRVIRAAFVQNRVFVLHTGKEFTE